MNDEQEHTFFNYSFLLDRFEFKLFSCGKDRQNFASNVTLYPCERSRQNHMDRTDIVTPLGSLMYAWHSCKWTVTRIESHHVGVSLNEIVGFKSMLTFVKPISKSEFSFQVC